MLPVLLDTGPLVALLDRSDDRHTDCVEAFAKLVSPLATTEAVLTETLHMLGDFRAQRLALQFVQRGATELVPTPASSMQAIERLMERYADIPMDYADATLVLLAGELGTNRIFTLDRRGFQSYRHLDGGYFDIIP